MFKVVLAEAGTYDTGIEVTSEYGQRVTVKLTEGGHFNRDDGDRKVLTADFNIDVLSAVVKAIAAHKETVR